jgi:hypothetical protein
MNFIKVKNTLLVLTCLIVVSAATAQQPITLTSADMPTAGWTQRTAKDTLPLPAINFGNKGANQVYDFSNLQPVVYDTIIGIYWCRPCHYC